MGQAITRICSEDENVCIKAGFDLNTEQKDGYPVYSQISELEKIKVEINCIVDFSHPSLFDDMLRFAADNRIPYVICTTGLSNEQKQKIVETAKESNVPVHKDEKLANTLSKLEIGDYIPPELYGVVAEILVFVDDCEKLKRKLDV